MSTEDPGFGQEYRLAMTALQLRSFTESELQSLTGLAEADVHSFLECLGKKEDGFLKFHHAEGPSPRYSLTTSGIEHLLERSSLIANTSARRPYRDARPSRQQVGHKVRNATSHQITETGRSSSLARAKNTTEGFTRLRQGSSFGRRPYIRPESEIYWSPKSVDLYSFDESYLRRLRERDAATEAHFVAYFSNLLRVKLRSRFFSAQVMEDVQQETFSRVITAVRAGEIRQPDRLGAYVNSVCNNVRLELYRDLTRNQDLDANFLDMVDPHTDLEEEMLQQERINAVRQVLDSLSVRDQNILRAVVDEHDKEEICEEFGVDRAYLRVLLLRFKRNFKVRFKKSL